MAAGDSGRLTSGTGAVSAGGAIPVVAATSSFRTEAVRADGCGVRGSASAVGYRARAVDAAIRRVADTTRRRTATLGAGRTRVSQLADALAGTGRESASDVSPTG